MIDDALECFSTALSFKPDYVEAHWALAMSQLALVYEADDDPEEFRSAFSRALSGLDIWFDADRIKDGREVFARVQCWKCHGVTGEANGPSAATLQDDLGRPISPFNFADGSSPKCGSSDQDIYRIFMTGLDGTPMPSFADNLKPDEAWDLVFYLRTLMSQPSKAKAIAKQLGLKPVDTNAGVGPQ
jgi:mono/diheme cytochrome c family protein